MNYLKQNLWRDEREVFILSPRGIQQASKFNSENVYFGIAPYYQPPQKKKEEGNKIRHEMISQQSRHHMKKKIRHKNAVSFFQ